jgi:hypothetical protein
MFTWLKGTFFYHDMYCHLILILYYPDRLDFSVPPYSAPYSASQSSNLQPCISPPSRRRLLWTQGEPHRAVCRHRCQILRSSFHLRLPRCILTWVAPCISKRSDRLVIRVCDVLRLSARTHHPASAVLRPPAQACLSEQRFSRVHGLVALACRQARDRGGEEEDKSVRGRVEGGESVCTVGALGLVCVLYT